MGDIDVAACHATLVAFLRAHRFSHVDEAELQVGIEHALRWCGKKFEREVRLGVHDRIDFLVEGGIGLEVKVAGAPAAVRRQLERYAGNQVVEALILVTSRGQLAADETRPRTSKPFAVVRTYGGLR